MTGLAGIRVMRGPDWQDADTDGGEGHLGTLKQLLSNQTVHVLWDNGQDGTYRAGTDGKFDLRIFDTAQTGVRHPSTCCAECGQNDIYGMVWRCQDCAGCDLCLLCYSKDKHDLRHRFLRLDHHKSQGQSVKKRKVSVRMRATGIFPGAKVKRGHDWTWGDQDGGLGSVGEVKAFENVAPDSSWNLVRVQWPRGACNSYRLGYHGNIDLTCVEEEAGPFYYRDHLPLLDSANLPYPLAPKEAFTSTKQRAPPSKSTTSANAAISTDTGIATGSSVSNNNSNDRTPSPINSDTPKTSSNQPDQLPSAQARSSQDVGAVGGTPVEGETTELESEEELSFSVGDSVAVAVNENTLRDLQEDYGGVSDNMIKKLGQKGTVTDVTTGIVVEFAAGSYKFNPLSLVKIPSLKEGDIVRIHRDTERVKTLNKHIAWNQQVAEVCGTAGRVTQVDNDDTVTVTFGHYQTFRFSPACCKPAPGATVDTVGAVGAARKPVGASAKTSVKADLKTKSAAAAAGGVPIYMYSNEGDGASKTTDKENDDDDDGDTNMQKALLRMMGMLGGSGSGLSESTDPKLRVLFSAISRGDAQAVETLVRSNMQLLTKTEQTLTPLMYACHKGRRQIVTKLLDMGSDVNGVGGQGRTPFYVALDSNEEDIALMLLDRGANPHTTTDNRRTPLHAAAYENLSQAVQVLVCLGADVNAKDGVEDTPLFDAIRKGNDAAVEILLQVGSLNYEELSATGFNMLQLASLEGKAKIVEMILTCERHPGVNDLLLGEYSALHIAANNDHAECVRTLVLLGGATVDISDGRRCLTPLHLACKKHQFSSAEALIQLGAAVNLIDISGNTPLHLAMGKTLEGEEDDWDVSRSTAVEQRSRVARLLISNGALTDVLDDAGKSPLSCGNTEVQDNVKRFLQQGDKTVHGISASSGKQSAAAQTISVGVTKDKTISDAADGNVSKQFDTNLMNSLLQGVSIQCAKCDAMSDVTLQPCGHKSVCRKCCDIITRCPLCDAEIADRMPDNTDDHAAAEKTDTDKQEDEEEEMNKFD